jgi:hypothetical protein
LITRIPGSNPANDRDVRPSVCYVLCR